MKAKCSRCGIESEVSEFYIPWLSPLRFRKIEYCPACNDRIVFLAIFLITIATIALAYGRQPGAFIWLTVNFALLFIAFSVPMSILHETSHALTAIVLKSRLLEVSIGYGKERLKLRIFGILIILRGFLQGGFVRFGTPPSADYKTRMAMIIVAGPITYLIVIVTTFMIIGEIPVSYLSHNNPEPLAALFWFNVILFTASFIPNTTFFSSSCIRNDTWQVIRTIKLTQEQLENTGPDFLITLAIHACESGQTEKARQWAEEAVNRYPGNVEALQGLGTVLSFLREYQAAKDIMRQLLDSEKLDPETKYASINDIAYMDLKLNDPSLLAEADSFSRSAYENMPWVPAVKGTRGSVLVELGQYEPGNKLLQSALKGVLRNQDKATYACYRAIAYKKLGELKKSNKHIEMARSLDPDCCLLQRAIDEELVRPESKCKDISPLVILPDEDKESEEGLVCSKCGIPVLPEWRICPECQRKPFETTGKHVYYCPECGVRVHPRSKLCHECGANLSSADIVRVLKNTVFWAAIVIVLGIAVTYWAFIIRACINDVPAEEAFLFMHGYVYHEFVVWFVVGIPMLLTFVFFQFQGRYKQVKVVAVDADQQIRKSRVRRRVVLLGLLAVIIIPLPLIHAFSSSHPIDNINGPIDSDWLIREWAFSPVAMALDDNGNIYVTGSEANLEWNWAEDYGYWLTGFAAKYSNDGERIWLSKYVTDYYLEPPGSVIAVDSNGNVHLTTGDGTLKFDSDGELIWRSDASGSEITLDDQGNIYVLGDRGLFKLTPKGEKVWYRRSTTQRPWIASEESWALTVDGQGNICAMGPNLSYDVRGEYTIEKYDTNGDRLWTATYDTYGDETAVFRHLLCDENGNLRITGFISQSGSLAFSGNLFSACYDSNGQMTEQVSYLDNDSGTINKIAVNRGGDIAIIRYSGTQDMTCTKYGNDGDMLWSVNSIDYDLSPEKSDVAIDEQGNVYTVYGLCDTGSASGVLARKYGPKGELEWEVVHRPGRNMKSWDLDYRALPTSFQVDSLENVYLATSGTRTGYGYRQGPFMDIIKYKVSK